MSLEQLLQSKTTELGFDRIGIISAEPIPEAEERFQQWLAQGYHGEMSYLSNNLQRRQNPQQVLPGAKSMIVVAINYNPSPHLTPYALRLTPLSRNKGSTGRIARYAWGRDYHKVLDKKLKQLETFLHEIAPVPIQTKRYVDTGPILEKAYAEQAGIGFIGKNTLLISKGLGSWLFLGEILTTLELNGSRATLRPFDKVYPEPFDPSTMLRAGFAQGKLRRGAQGRQSSGQASHGSQFSSACGSCTRCLDACPTQAFTAPYQLDARKCIAYLTIEHRSPIPEELQPQMDDWIFGCDICQEVCPYNRHAPQTKEPAFHAEAGAGPTLSLDKVLAIQSDEEYLKRFQGTPLMRAKRVGLQRNATVVLKNR